MTTSKEKIIEEIKRVAKASGGMSPGKGTFEQKTGIKSTEWEGRYWTKWSDALLEAGFQPNTFGAPAYDDDFVLEKLAELTRELGHIPNRNEIRLRKRTDSELPTDGTIRNKFGSKLSLVERLLEFVEENASWSELVPVIKTELHSLQKATPVTSDLIDSNTSVGYVYLMQHGSRKEYKIGFTSNPIRREGEISIELPEKVTPIHTIETDDPSGVEAYWHRRFSSKRKNGEWFELSNTDIKSFKKWKKIY